MILRTLRLTNFRQFAGEQVIDFACSAENNQIVTVVHGANGRGKTGIFRAVMYCLYGDARLLQDGNVAKEDLQLANESALRNSNGQPVTVSVQLSFSHDGEDYALDRSMLCLRDGRTIHVEHNAPELSITTQDGNTEIVEADQIASRIENVIDKRIRDYFLFDGERIERLTRATAKQRNEISQFIRNLLDIDILEVAVGSLEYLSKDLQHHLEQNTTGDYQRLLFERRETEEHLASIKSRLDELKDERAIATDETVDIESKLETYQEIREHLRERSQLKTLRVDVEERRQQELQKIAARCGQAAGLLTAEPIEHAFKHIEKQRQRGDLPSEVRKDLIERILAEHRCICGRGLEDGSQEYCEIMEWFNRTQDSTAQDNALNLWRDLSKVRSRFRSTEKEIEGNLLTFGNLTNQLRKIRLDLQKVSDAIGDSERKDAADLERQLRQRQQDIAKIDVEVDQLKNKGETLQQELKVLKARIAEEQRKHKHQNELARRLELSREAKDALEVSKSRFIEKVRSQVGEYATEIFERLIDPESYTVLKQIVVKEDYSLQLLDQYGNPFLANISAGQRQVMSISFVTALARAASGGSLYEVPLFMDTPFGRLSSEHRKNLILQLPNLCSQWVLLATDTEFGPQEANLLKQSDSWTKFYILDPTPEGNTIIRQQDVDTALLQASKGRA